MKCFCLKLGYRGVRTKEELSFCHAATGQISSPPRCRRYALISVSLAVDTINLRLLTTLYIILKIRKWVRQIWRSQVSVVLIEVPFSNTSWHNFHPEHYRKTHYILQIHFLGFNKNQHHDKPNHLDPRLLICSAATSSADAPLSTAIHIQIASSPSGNRTLAITDDGSPSKGPDNQGNADSKTTYRGDLS